MYSTPRLPGGRTLLAVSAAAAVFTLSGCGASPKGELKEACRSAVADHAAADLAEVEITESIETPGGSLGWRGSYPGGTFACAAGLNPNELYQVIVYAPDGTPTVVML